MHASLDGLPVAISANTTLELITGPMTAGKSTELTRRVNSFWGIFDVLILNHVLDTRSPSQSIATHNGTIVKANKCETLMSIVDTPNYTKAHVIAIDEAQFFDDLVEFIMHVFRTAVKRLIIAGLNGRFNQSAFLPFDALMPYVTHVSVLQAYCKICNNGTPAPYSKKLVVRQDDFDESGKPKDDAGGMDKY